MNDHAGGIPAASTMPGAPGAAPLFEVERLASGYGRIPILGELSFTVRAGRARHRRGGRDAARVVVHAALLPR